MAEESAVHNMQKCRNYRDQMVRLNRALEFEFYLEAVFIEYAVMEDRLSSALRHAGKKVPRGISRKIGILCKLQNQGYEPAETLGDLLSDVYAWKEERNSLMHGLMEQDVSTEQLRDLALSGQEIAKELNKAVARFNRAVARLEREVAE